MPSKTDSLSSARAPPNRPFIPTFLPCLIDSAAAPTGHAEISISSRAFPLRRNHANRAQLRFSMLPPSPQPFIPFFRSTTPRRRRVENKDFAIASIMLEINRSYEIYTVEVIWQCISMYFIVTLVFCFPIVWSRWLVWKKDLEKGRQRIIRVIILISRLRCLVVKRDCGERYNMGWLTIYDDRFTPFLSSKF